MDPMTFEDAHSKPPSEINKLIDDNEAFPVLVSQASIYPNGRMMPVIMKGIEPNQELINLPTKVLNTQNNSYIPVLIGRGMAKYTKLKEGDTFMLRWLDANKTYDANDGVIVHIMDTENFKVDMGQIWLPIEHLQKMLDMPKEATYVTYKKKIS